ncbi:MAG: hypothetical protein V4546_10290 [Bacteroidota bacterium]
MKNLILISLSLTIILGCRTKYNYPKFDFNNGPNPCINAFKDRVFMSILKESYKGTTALTEINKIDLGNPFDGVYDLVLLKKIGSIGKDFVKKIPLPSLCSDCSEGQNYFMVQALHYYRSRELDSVAKVELKKFSADCLN